MQLGVYLNAQHPAEDDPARRFAETVEQVRLIRTLGFDSIWGGEHHATPGFHYFPLLPFLQRLAAEADGLWVGTNLIDPLAAAQPGRGGRDRRLPRRDHRRAVPARRGPRLPARGVRALRGAAGRAGEAGSSRGSRSFAGSGPRMGSPIAAATGSSTGSQSGPGRSSSRGLPFSSARRCPRGSRGRPASRTAGWWFRCRRWTSSRPRPPPSPAPGPRRACRPAGTSAACSKSCARRTRPPRSAGRPPSSCTKYAAYLAWGIPGITLDPGAAPEAQLRRLAANRFAIGSPPQVVEALLAQHRAGVTHATMRVSSPGMPQADILAGIELLGREVLPEVRRRAVADSALAADRDCCGC